MSMNQNAILQKMSGEKRLEQAFHLSDLVLELDQLGMSKKIKGTGSLLRKEKKMRRSSSQS